MKEIIVYVIVFGFLHLASDWNNPNFFDDNMLVILSLSCLSVIFDRVD